MSLACTWKKIRFNVSGDTYETKDTTLQRFPNTLLGDCKRRCDYFDEKSLCYFFNRSRMAFDAILFYYQSNGCLVRPPSLPMQLFEHECLFYDLGDKAIENMKEREGYDCKKKVYQFKVNNDCKLGFNWLWEFLEFSDSSLCSKIYTYISLFFILLIIIIDCIETIPGIHNNELSEKLFRIIKLNLNIFFAVEFSFRFISCPQKKSFLMDVSNMIDFVTVLPSIVSYLVKYKKLEAVVITRVLRTFRIFRLIRVSKNFHTLSVVLHIISNSLANLFMLVFCMFISITLFGSMVYYTELGTEGTPLTSIPQGMYFAMQTVVSVGYGDIIPLSVLGKITAAITAVIGALTMTLPLLSLGGKYFAIYTRTFSISLSTQVITKPSTTAVEHYKKQCKR